MTQGTTGRTLIPFTDVFEDSAEPSPAWGFADPTGDPEDVYVFLRCNCGQLTGLGRHTIETDGTVNPSVYHLHGCGWHVFIKLIGYEERTCDRQSGIRDWLAQAAPGN